MAKQGDLKKAGSVDRVYKALKIEGEIMDGSAKKPSRNETYRDKLREQLELFANDNSYLDKYRSDKIRGRNVLVRVFKFFGKDVHSSKILLPGGKVAGTLQSPVKVEDVIYDNKVLPIGKVIKVGSGVEDNDIVEGSIVMLPKEEVEGMAKNPDFLHYLQYKDAQGINPNFSPEDIPKEIPKIQLEWLRYQYKHWLNIDTDDDDTLTYLLPENKII